MKVCALILAGGTGSRTGLNAPKQLADLAGKPVICHTIGCFERSGSVHSIIIVSHADSIGQIRSIVASHGYTKVAAIVEGGATRQESSYVGISACGRISCDIVLIHDAARPFVDESIIRDTILAATETGAALPGIPPSDTIFEHSGGKRIERVLDRGMLMCAQTPQGFRFETIRDAHERALADGFCEATDDAGLVMRIGGACAVVQGSVDNIKITTARDFLIAGAILKKG